ncbi:glycosyltransferase [Chryseobacterium sp. CFS15]|uniref:glycosyltransferase n=1 Tax=Chryseobacterium sp. CFS15 TaxID=2986946 RepID=UPI0028089307|nr:glycosyltransferase [Chryseobacterium sp. CFS15]MDQ8144323.1 glycosyltransferase [Chryseobacterium sp. CFS15]
MKKRMLIIHHGRGLGGGLIALLGLIDELKKNYNVAVFCIFNSEAIEYIEQRGVNVIRPKSFIFYKYFYKIFSHTSANYFNFIKYILKLYKFLTYHVNKYIFSKIEYNFLIKDYDLVYLNSTFISDWAYYPSKKGKKVIIHIREPLKDDRKFIFYNLIRSNIKKNCDWVVAITKDNAGRLNLLNKTTVIYDPIIKIRNKKETILEENYETDSEHRYFTYLGGSSRIKGFEQLVHSLKYLNNDVKIFFLGSYTDKLSSLNQLIKGIFDPYIFKSIRLYRILKKSPNAIIIGKTQDVFYYYKKSVATISCFSKPHASLPILESFSERVPVIVSDITGMDEFVKKNENGFFFQNGNSLDLANTINHVANLKENDFAVLRNNTEKMCGLIANFEMLSRVIDKILMKK